MNLLKWTFPVAVMAMLFIGFSGCDSSQPPDTDVSLIESETENSMNHDAMEHQSMEHGDHATEGHDHAAHGVDNAAEEISTAKSDMEKMTEALASFSDDDRKSAMKQHFCPVSGEMLGVMGKPEKMEVEGQTVWICCDGCKEKLLAEPDKYLAKLSK